MANECINDNCQSKPEKKLYAAQRSVCNYYNVQYKPNRQVCRLCIQIYMVNFDKFIRRFKNQEYVFDEKVSKIHNIPIIELSDSDDDNAANNATMPSTENTKLQIATSLNIIMNDTVEPLINIQNELCESYMASQKAELISENEQLNNLKQQVDERISQNYRKLYKFYSQKKFKFDEEISIDDKNELMDKDVVLISAIKLPRFPDDLPAKGKLIRLLLKLGDRVYGMKHSQLQPWVEATIKSTISNTYFNIVFDDGEETVLNSKSLAYRDSSNALYPVGSRVIAKFQDMNIKLTDKFYVGVIAEPPKYLNSFRYMVFFDDGYAQYVYHKNIRLVCGQSPDVSDDVHENIREFVKEYLQNYPERPMVKLNKKQVVRTELNDIWCSAKVKNVDASLVQLKFLERKYKYTEWIYRGSNRLAPIYNRLSSNNEDKRIRTTVLTDVNKLLNRPYI